MPQEIERKFLVSGDFKPFATGSSRIVQGYLSSVAERTVRVRIKGAHGYLTIKGIGNESGASRFEWEREIPLHEAEDLLELCEPGAISKTRFFVPVGDHLFEVDEFHDANAGLVIAEIELADEAELFAKPDWLGAEVTGQTAYYNAALMKKPFTRW